MENVLSFLGRLLIAAIFIMSGLSKIGNYAGTVQYMSAKGIPMAPFFLYGAVLFEVAGGLMIALGLRYRIGALMLIVFLIPTTIIFHGNFADRVEMIQFLKNLSIMGSLVFIFANGPGKWAIGKN